MLLVTALTTVALAGCPEPIPAASVDEAIVAAEAAFASMDETGFARQAVAARTRLECLDQAVPLGTATGLHRLEALRGFVDVDEARTRAAFASMLAVSPDATLPDSLAPVGHPLRESLALARTRASAPEAKLPRIAGSKLLVDGVVARTHPTDRPFVLQRDDSARGWSSTYVDDPAVLPPWVTPETKARSPRVAMLVGAGGGAAVAGGLYAYAWTQRARYDDPTTPLDDLGALRGRTNGATAAAAIVGGVAVAVGVTAVVVRW